MPARLSSKNLVARPDRVDFRDREYQPPLKSLLPQWPPKQLIERNLAEYAPLILDQKSEGKCTGFGLAAVINFIFWSAYRERILAMETLAKQKLKEPPPLQVSSHMLYHNARLYDEWEGEDYEGSSCRGAMKGWHKHGVCNTSLWDPNAKMQKEAWRTDAAKRPLGAYYRINAKSISDMQSAIFEMRSIYCSADVHEGWREPREQTNVDGVKIARIKESSENIGGHAFAIVGYTNEGFIVQNSWGKDWGTHGFALMTYDDWIANGYDAWIASLGAPMLSKSPATAGRSNLVSAAFDKPAKSAAKSSTAASIWTEEQAYRHAIVLGNDGKLIQRIVGAKDPEAALKSVLVDEVIAHKHKHIAIYVHGGLNDEESAIGRARRMGPWFDVNGIHPIFLVWRTGLMETLGNIAADDIKKYEEQAKSIRAKGFGSAIESALNALAEAKDRAFEVAAEKLIGKAVWTQMKQNAAMAAQGSGPLVKIAKLLGGHAGVRLHVMGHSAGAIMLGHLLDVAGRSTSPLSIDTCTLFAPACRLDFAAEKYGKALIAGGPLAKGHLHIDVLSDKAEVDDGVGPYGKSLLYLVSRALEEVHKTPLLGLDIAVAPERYILANGIKKKTGMELNADLQKKASAQWSKAVSGLANVKVQHHDGPKIKTSVTAEIEISHGSFDNDINVMNASLERILRGPLTKKIKDLSGF